MSTSIARTLASDVHARFGANPTLTMFDRGEPSTCLTVRLVRRGAGFAGFATDGGLLVDRLRLGLRPAYFCQVEGQVLEGELEVRVRDRSAASAEAQDSAPDTVRPKDAVVIDVLIKSAAPAAPDTAPGSIPRT